MLKKGSKLYSILTGSCPNCHQESMYLDKNPFHFKNLFKMHDTCSYCNTKYEIEPSFFYGAMYVSYGLTVGLGIAIYVLFNVVFGFAILPTFCAIISGILLFTPITIRLARNIYINLFIHYDNNWKENKE